MQYFKKNVDVLSEIIVPLRVFISLRVVTMHLATRIVNMKSTNFVYYYRL